MTRPDRHQIDAALSYIRHLRSPMRRYYADQVLHELLHNPNANVEKINPRGLSVPAQSAIVFNLHDYLYPPRA